MSRARRPIFVGEWIDETTKRGRPTDTDTGRQLEWRQNCAVSEIIARRLLGENLKDATEHTAESIALHAQAWKCEEDALRDLYRANVRDAITLVAQDLVLCKKLSIEKAMSRTETILAELDKRRDAQLKSRKG